MAGASPIRPGRGGRRLGLHASQNLERRECDHLAGLPRNLERGRGRSVLRMGPEPFGHPALDVRMDRVEVPSPVRSSPFPKECEREGQSWIGGVPERLKGAGPNKTAVE